MGKVGWLQKLHILQMLQVLWCNIAVGVRPLLKAGREQRQVVAFHLGSL
jgi:hypothetical protein